jgi:hypothetical protein
VSALGVGVVLGVVGCQQSEFDMAEMAAVQKARPEELRKLDFLVGNWSTTMEGKMAGADEMMKGSGTGETMWALNDRYLVTTMTAEMGEMGSMVGREVWTYDPSIGKFRTWWFDDWGMTGEGKAWHDATTGVWHMKGHGYNTVDGRKTMMKGTMKPIDANTLEWTWSEYDSLGLIKFMDMTGVSKRQ